MTGGNKYFAFLDGNQQGPYDPEQLVAAGVRPSTYVWCKGMADWERADSVDEIRELFRRHISEHKETPRKEKAIDENLQNPVKGPQPDESKPERIFFGRIPESVEPEPDLNTPPQVSMTLAVLSLLLCFPPTGIAAVVFTHKAQKAWDESLKDQASSENLKRQAHEYERLAKMWMGLTIAFGLIFWTVLFSVRT